MLFANLVYLGGIENILKLERMLKKFRIQRDKPMTFAMPSAKINALTIYGANKRWLELLFLSIKAIFFLTERNDSMDTVQQTELLGYMFKLLVPHQVSC